MSSNPPTRTVVGFDAVVRPGAKPGEHIITQRSMLQVRGTVKLAAQVLGTSVDTVKRLIYKKKISAMKPNGGKYVVDMLTVYQHRDASKN